MMSYVSLSNSFWGHALETAQYILNLVPFKAISTTLKEPGLGESLVWIMFGFGVV